MTQLSINARVTRMYELERAEYRVFYLFGKLIGLMNGDLIKKYDALEIAITKGICETELKKEVHNFPELLKSWGFLKEYKS